MVYFPYELIYPEQYEYMQEIKRALDAKVASALSPQYRIVANSHCY
jgi:DNA excision repair protein ERCC-2